jgi:hypothetical protein
VTIIEAQPSGGFIISKGRGDISVDQGTLAPRLLPYYDGTFLKRNEDIVSEWEEGDPIEELDGVLIGYHLTQDEPRAFRLCAYVARLAEVHDEVLLWGAMSDETRDTVRQRLVDLTIYPRVGGQSLDTEEPSSEPASEAPSEPASEAPSDEPTSEAIPSEEPTSEAPSEEPTSEAPSEPPSEEPTSEAPSEAPSEPPSEEPTSEVPSEPPSEAPTSEAPSEEPTSEAPSEEPTSEPPSEDPPPEFSSINPTSGSSLGGRSVTITGVNLTGATGVTIGGSAATSVVVVNDTTITCVTPAHAAGASDVVVTTPAGSDTGTAAYTYNAPASSYIDGNFNAANAPADATLNIGTYSPGAKVLLCAMAYGNSAGTITGMTMDWAGNGTPVAMTPLRSVDIVNAANWCAVGWYIADHPGPGITSATFLATASAIRAGWSYSATLLEHANWAFVTGASGSSSTNTASTSLSVNAGDHVFAGYQNRLSSGPEAIGTGLYQYRASRVAVSTGSLSVSGQASGAATLNFTGVDHDETFGVESTTGGNDRSRIDVIAMRPS